MSSLPKGPFGTVCIDPPWEFDNKATRAAAAKHYPTVRCLELQGLLVSQIVKKDAHCYLWTTDSHLVNALSLMNEWGFRFKMPLVWVKMKTSRLQIGLGNWYRHAHELCLFGVRGKAKAEVHNLPSVIFAPRTEHSAKPEQLQDYAEKLSPPPYCELFARRLRQGWTCWGDGLP